MVHHNPKHVMDKIDSFLPLKPDSIGPPKMYLGAKLQKETFEDGTVAWGVSPLKYVQQAVRNFEIFLKTNLDGRYSLPKQAENPFPCDYAPMRMFHHCWNRTRLQITVFGYCPNLQ